MEKQIRMKICGLFLLVASASSLLCLPAEASSFGETNGTGLIKTEILKTNNIGQTRYVRYRGRIYRVRYRRRAYRPRYRRHYGSYRYYRRPRRHYRYYHRRHYRRYRRY